MKKLTSLVLALLLTLSLCVPALAEFDVDGPDGPDDWAKAEIFGAVGAGLVPEDLLCDYRAPITRAEFCRLVVQLMRKTFAEDFVEFAEENGGFSHSFTDTNDREILAAAELAIVNGVGGGKFNPNGSITRQEAATMLARAANVLMLTPGLALNFQDAGQFADWARDGIDFTSGLIDPFNQWRVMGGTGNDMFSPFDSYTREQAICTMMRIYDNWLMKTMDPDGYNEMFGFG